jgi:hypothetical protein
LERNTFSVLSTAWQNQAAMAGGAGFGVDSQTRRDITRHENTSMDNRYTMIDDEAVEDARQKMSAFQLAADSQRDRSGKANRRIASGDPPPPGFNSSK